MNKIVALFVIFLLGIGCSESDNDPNDDNIIEIPTVPDPIEETPTFENGEDPKPNGKVWEKVELLSDEFDGNALDTNKWALLIDTWAGRPPAIFKEDAVTLENGDLRITNYMLNNEEIVNGNSYTHAGGLVRSVNAAEPGMYFECRMKANKTFMSSTFWLINVKNEGTGCDKRTTELDIQECVGQVTTTSSWAEDFDKKMHSNTHSRNATCSETEQGSKGNNAGTGLVYEDYHVYAAWWKSPTEIQFFLDGEHQYTVNPVENFDLLMYLRLVTETYDWNPVPSDGGLTGDWEDRTTKYDWVRTWKLTEE